MAVDISKFDRFFRNQPDFERITEEIERSPRLVDLIDRFQGKIKLGKPESGGYYSPQKRRINIDRNWVDKLSTSSDPDYLGRFVSILSHELGHAVVPGGMGEINEQTTLWGRFSTHLKGKNAVKPTLPDYVAAKLRGEGVAILTEYQVANERDALMWSGGPRLGRLQRRLDALLAIYNNNRDHPQFAKNTIAIGAEFSHLKHPSIAPELTYDDYFSTCYVLDYGRHDYTSDEIERIDWRHITPAEVALKPEEAGQPREFAHPLRLIPLSPPTLSVDTHTPLSPCGRGAGGEGASRKIDDNILVSNFETARSLDKRSAVQGSCHSMRSIANVASSDASATPQDHPQPHRRAPAQESSAFDCTP